MRRPGADLEVEGLLDQASIRRPELLQLEDEVLKGQVSRVSVWARGQT
jgi:hypothetical protein